MNAMQGFDMLHDGLVNGLGAISARRVAVRNVAAGLVRDAEMRAELARLRELVAEVRNIANLRGAEIMRLRRIITEAGGSYDPS